MHWRGGAAGWMGEGSRCRAEGVGDVVHYAL